jgi:hypothetical protein
MVELFGTVWRRREDNELMFWERVRGNDHAKSALIDEYSVGEDSAYPQGMKK